LTGENKTGTSSTNEMQPPTPERGKHHGTKLESCRRPERRQGEGALKRARRLNHARFLLAASASHSAADLASVY